MIDKTRINELAAEIGLEDVQVIAAVFLDEAMLTVDRLAEGLPPEEVSRAMHFLRSGALNIGLRGIALLAEEAEAKSNRGEDIEVAHMVELINRTRAQLEEGLMTV